MPNAHDELLLLHSGLETAASVCVGSKQLRNLPSSIPCVRPRAACLPSTDHQPSDSVSRGMVARGELSGMPAGVHEEEYNDSAIEEVLYMTPVSPWTATFESTIA